MDPESDFTHSECVRELIVNTTKACSGGHLEVSLVLMNAAPSTIETPDYKKSTPLYSAADKGHARVVEALMVAKAFGDSRAAKPSGMPLNTGTSPSLILIVTQRDDPCDPVCFQRACQCSGGIHNL